jgi:[DsrC]-trisulfide reductase subunit J
MLRRLVFGVLLVAAAAVAADPAGRTPRPVVERAVKGGQCVADPALMRRNHMEMLKHQRDDTVRAGVRAGPFSLKACIECHASRETGSVAKGETNFCISCHSYAAVQIDCFECHASKPPARGTAFAPVVPNAFRVAAQAQQAPREGTSK